jgi:glycosyltransferase involved in cell wall biosynthesis
MTHLKDAQLKQERETKFPSFSIVYETENLESVELENIYRSLSSLAAQDISPAQANEFLIIDSGDAPAEVIEQLCSMYPWITVRRVPEIGYYEAKMMGATLVTGEIIVFCDSDCVYEPNWLRNIVTTFRENSDINVVAGETSTPVRNLYELAIAIHYFFPRFSGLEHPYESQNYFLNAVAFRRNFLLQHPIPCDLPIYRGNCWLHAYSLCNLQGYTIWIHPQARAIHEPPTMSFTFWRYLLMGRDQIVRERLKLLLTNTQDTADDSKSSPHLGQTPYQRIRSRAGRVWWELKQLKRKQIITVLREEPRRLILLPLAVPIILWFELLFNIGRAITYFQPDLLLKRYQEIESKDNESASMSRSVASTVSNRGGLL